MRNSNFSAQHIKRRLYKYVSFEGFSYLNMWLVWKMYVFLICVQCASTYFQSLNSLFVLFFCTHTAFITLCCIRCGIAIRLGVILTRNFLRLKPMLPWTYYIYDDPLFFCSIYEAAAFAYVLPLLLLSSSSSVAFTFAHANYIYEKHCELSVLSISAYKRCERVYVFRINIV